MARWSKANSTALSADETPTGDRPIRPMWAFSSIVPQKWGGGFAFSLAMQKSAVRCTKKGKHFVYTNHRNEPQKGIAPVQLPPGRPKIEHLVEHRAGERPLFRVFGKQPPWGPQKRPPCRESGMWKFHTGLVTHKKPVTSGEE